MQDSSHPIVQNNSRSSDSPEWLPLLCLSAIERGEETRSAWRTAWAASPPPAAYAPSVRKAVWWLRQRSLPLPAPRKVVSIPRYGPCATPCGRTHTRPSAHHYRHTARTLLQGRFTQHTASLSFGPSPSGYVDTPIPLTPRHLPVFFFGIRGA